MRGSWGWIFPKQEVHEEQVAISYQDGSQASGSRFPLHGVLSYSLKSFRGHLKVTLEERKREKHVSLQNGYFSTNNWRPLLDSKMVISLHVQNVSKISNSCSFIAVLLYLYCFFSYFYILRTPTLSILKRAWYWGISAFFGSVRICTNMSAVRLWSGTTTGKRPTNSGIIPNSIKSLASTLRSSASFSSISSIASVSSP